MLSHVAGVAFRTDSPELLERGRDNVLRLLPSRAGVALTPSSATVTVYDRAGVAIVSAAPATREDGQAAYTLLAAATSSLPLDGGWTVSWTVRLAGESVDRVVSVEAALVRQRVYPVLGDVDLFRRVPSLDPNDVACPFSYTYQSFRDDAWSTIHDRLVLLDRRPWLAMSPCAFREVHLLLTLARIYADAGNSRAVEDYRTAARDYERQFERAWSRMQWVFDADELGLASSEREPVATSIWFGGAC